MSEGSRSTSGWESRRESRGPLFASRASDTGPCFVERSPVTQQDRSPSQTGWTAVLEAQKPDSPERRAAPYNGVVWVDDFFLGEFPSGPARRK